MSDTYNNPDEPAHPDDAPSGPERLPLDAWHRQRGARMVPFAGYEMPVQYVVEGGGIIAEHLWTRSHAGLFDVSHMGQLEVSGEGAAAALEAALPIDLATLKPGGVRYSLLLDEHGGILDDLMVTNAVHHFYLVVNGATKWDDIAHLREHLPDAVTLSHLADDALLALQGPEAATALARLGLAPMNDGWPTAQTITFMQAAPFRWGEVPLRISRSGYTGEDGYEISVPGEHAAALADALCAQPEVKPIGLGARDSLRLEAGLPLYGHDITAETDPVEAGLTFAINKRRRSEGGFLGANPILAALAAGPARKRVGLALEGRMAARESDAVLRAGSATGRVTSGGFAPSLGRPIAMAYVEAADAAPGTSLEIEVRGKRIAATVVPLPFIPHRYFR
ncbi:glycine cleavage system aminomethyltransferase GcvT [Novosphingobium sp. Gsoil 351]|uniref:glycine cleavage system aminomethyltransferase GcvT n=1 Tax=Novosphingobium sp. Gsoil 351 TaxID=2675225 RepID=UPI0012B44D90|nr:glycine cleavage system aminomethyltransferase GcvT [Novosphingobium sp. Gsoil 351]QGN53517.1 glycine cleavage system aminomethyltransferase GcvT [Novosphingobium sp. Gsoil 351]